MQQQQQTQQPMVDIKQEPVDGDGGADGKVLIESLYTSKGLAPSYNDLEQLFDEDNSDASPGGVSDNFIFFIKCVLFAVGFCTLCRYTLRPVQINHLAAVMTIRSVTLV